MPYKLVKSGSKATVVNADTGRKASHHPIALAKAKAQLRLLQSIYYKNKI
jgi:hypothetical protein